jgi:hypothetical protein
MILEIVCSGSGMPVIRGFSSWGIEIWNINRIFTSRRTCPVSIKVIEEDM